MPKTTKNIITELQLIVDTELEDLFAASKNLNPFLTYVRFILTDSKPNANGDIVPPEEFSNLLQTGLYMPLKMALGEIKDGHDASVPLGVITHLRVDGDLIRGVAALWNRERPADIAFIKERNANGEPLDLSWELGFDPELSEITEEGYRILRGCVLRATTLVGIPAYEGRTPITDIDSSSDESKEEESVKELEQLNKELELKVETLEAEIQTLQEASEVLVANQLTDEVSEELEELRSFKHEIEAEALKLQAVAEIRTAFEEAGVNKSSEFFSTNEEKLLTLKETDMLDFFIASLVSEEEEEEEDELEDEESEDDADASADEDESEEEVNSTKLPKIRNLKLGDGEYSTGELAKALREKRQKQSK